jgi:hypothetical protein
MSIENTNPQRSAARPRVWITAWAIFLAILFAYGWYNARQVEQYREAQARWEKAQAEHAKQSQVEIQRIGNLLSNLVGKASQREVEQQLNRGHPFELRREGDAEVATWQAPDYFVNSELSFRGGTLVGSSVGFDGNFAQRNPAPIAPWTKPAEAWRHWFVHVAAWTWGIAGAAWIAIPRGRLLTAQIMLAAALAAGTALAVHPGYSMTWQGIFSNDNLFFAAIMLAISIVALALTLRQQHTEMSFRVQFGLRHALIAITVFAIILATGPFGYLTFAVAVFGITSFATAYFFKRRPATAPGEQWPASAASHQELP